MGTQTKKYKGKTYTYERKIHYWTVEDLARVSKCLVKNNRASPIEIVAVVAMATGLGMLICKAARTYRRITSLLDFIKGIALTSAIGFGLKALMQYLIKAPLLKVPVIDRITYVVIAVLFFVLKIFDAVVHFSQDIVFIEEVATVLETGCDFVRKYTIESHAFDGIDLSDLYEVEPPPFDFSFDTGNLLNSINNVQDLFEES